MNQSFADTNSLRCGDTRRRLLLVNDNMKDFPKKFDFLITSQDQLDQQQNQNNKQVQKPEQFENINCIKRAGSQNQIQSNEKIALFFSNQNQNINIYFSSKDSPVQDLYRSKTKQQEAKYVDISQHFKVVSEKKAGLNEVWKKSSLAILMFVKKAVDKFKSYNSKIRFSMLSKHQFNLILDQASNYKFFKRRKCFIKDQPNFFSLKKRLLVENQLVQYLQKALIRLFCNELIYQQLAKNFKIINPDSIFKLFWDSLILIILVINIFYIPLEVGFTYHSEFTINEVQIFFDDIPAWFFLIDLLLKFNTAFYDKGVIVVERKTIFKNYLHNQFIWDFIIIFPYFLSLIFSIPYLDAILLLRSNKMIKILNNFAERFNLRDHMMAYYDLFKLLLMIIFVAHLSACILNFVADIETQNGIDQNWLIKQNLQYSSWLEQYIAAFYWAVITMLTVGYGDITPTNKIERIVVVIMTMMSCGVFGYALNQIGNIVQSIYKKDNEFKAKMATLTVHMKKRQMSNELQMKVKKYFEYLHDEQSEDNEAGDQMLNQLVGDLKKDVLLDIYGRLIKNKKQFKLNFSDAFLTELALKMKEKRLAPEEVIFKQNEILDKIFFLMRGSVNLIIQSQQANEGQIHCVIKTLDNEDCFGQDSFFSGMPTYYSATATNVVSLVYLMKSDFLNIIKNYQQDFEIYCQLKDKINLYQETKGLAIKCFSCDNFNHTTKECPMIHQQQRKEKIIFLGCRQQLEQSRGQYKRSDMRGENTLLIQEVVKNQGIQFIVENQELLKIDDLDQVIQNLIQTKHQGFQKISELSINTIIEQNAEQDQLSNKKNASRSSILSEGDSMLEKDSSSISNSMPTIEVSKKDINTNTNIFQTNSQLIIHDNSNIMSRPSSNQQDQKRNSCDVIKENRTRVSIRRNSQQPITLQQRRNSLLQIKQIQADTETTDKLKNNNQQYQQFIAEDFDKLFLWTQYFTYNNYDKIIKALLIKKGQRNASEELSARKKSKKKFHTQIHLMNRSKRSITIIRTKNKQKTAVNQLNIPPNY